MTRQRLSRGTIGFIAAVIAAGSVALVARMPGLSAWATVDLLAFVGLVAVTVIGESFTAKVRFGSETKNVSLTESAYAMALLLGIRPGVLTVAAVLGVSLAHTSRGTAPHKIAFNAASYAVAVSAAEVVFGLLQPASPLTATALAMAAFFAVNSVTVVGVIALATRQGFARVFAPIARLEVSQAGGNLLLGALAAATWTSAPAPVFVLSAALVAATAAAVAVRRHHQAV